VLKVQLICFSGVVLLISGCVSPYATIDSSGAGYKKKASSYSVSDAYNPTLSSEASTFINTGNKFYQDGKYTEALEKFNKAAELFPNSWLILQWQGCVLAQLGRFDEAVTVLKNAQNGPVNTYNVTFSWLGYVYRKKSEYDSALNYYKQALQYGGSALDYFAVGNVYELSGNQDEAINNFTKAIDNNNYADMEANYANFSKPRCYEHRGYAYYKKGMLDQAKADVKKISELYPRYERAFGAEQNMLAYFEFDKRKKIASEALESAKQAENAGNYLEAFNQLEKAFSWMPVYDHISFDNLDGEIISGYYRVYPKLSVKPALPEIARRFFVQADVYTKNKNYNAAINMYNELISITPWYPEAWYNAAFLRAENKQYKKAIENMKIYLQLAPSASDARAAQDKIYEWEAL